MFKKIQLVTSSVYNAILTLTFQPTTIEVPVDGYVRGPCVGVVAPAVVAVAVVVYV